MLTVDQIRRILEELGWRTEYEDKVRLQVKTFGYSHDPVIGQIQATLSIMLEAAARKNKV